MKKTAFFIITSLFLASAAMAADSQIWGGMIISNILEYGKGSSLNLGPLFTFLQGIWFKRAFLAVVICVPAAFLVHYVIWGPKVFSHDGEKIYVFTLFQRVIHFLAVISFMVLVPTGLMIVFGKYLGGGGPVIIARYLHGVATVVFLVSVFPMFLFWALEMLPTLDDVKWMFILGGYLSKKKREIPAGKFNAGQKMWFWVSTIGGVVMIATGIFMYLQDFDLGIAAYFGLSQIDLLRASAIMHNVLAILITAFFFTHAYMSLFAIKGAVHSMITGYKEEEEVRYLHSSYYKKLRNM